MKKKIVSLLLALLVTAGMPLAAHADDDMDEIGSLELNVKVSIEEIRRRCAGGTDYLDKYGVTRRSLVAELQAHEHDNYYLGTPQAGGDWQSPRGDTSYNGQAGMNCAGFVAYVLRKSGMDGDAVTEVMKQSPTALSWGSPRRYEYLSGASNYLSFIQYGHLKAHVFETKWELLASGLAEKGDLIMRFWTDNFSGNDVDNHLMIYWGSAPHEDKVWHSSSGNSIAPIPEVRASAFVLIKFAPPSVAGYKDVYEGDWYAPAIEYVKKNGYMTGTEAARFKPSGTVTRAQTVQTLYNLAGRPGTDAASPFEDISGHWAEPAINWAYQAGITDGVSGNFFDPESPVTREQVAQLFMKYAAYTGGADSSFDPACLYAFGDRAAVSPWAEDSMAWAVGYGLISGVNRKLLDPRGTCTRGQLAQVVRNYFETNPPKQ